MNVKATENRSAVMHGFVYQKGRFTTINAPGAGRRSGEGTSAGSIRWMCQAPETRSWAASRTAADRSGLLVGGYQVRGHRRLVGFTYHHRVFRTLRDPSATGSTDPQGGNDRSRVVGFYTNTLNVATGFRFTPGTSPAAVPGFRAGTGQGRLPFSPRVGRP